MPVLDDDFDDVGSVEDENVLDHEDEFEAGEEADVAHNNEDDEPDFEDFDRNYDDAYDPDEDE